MNLMNLLSDYSSFSVTKPFYKIKCLIALATFFDIFSSVFTVFISSILVLFFKLKSHYNLLVSYFICVLSNPIRSSKNLFIALNNFNSNSSPFSIINSSNIFLCFY